MLEGSKALLSGIFKPQPGSIPHRSQAPKTLQIVGVRDISPFISKSASVGGPCRAIFENCQTSAIVKRD